MPITKLTKAALAAADEPRKIRADIHKAAAITPALMRLYNPGASGSLLAVSNHPFMRAFLEKAVGKDGTARYTDADGRPTLEAAALANRALMTAIFGKSENVREMLRSLLERAGELSLGTLQRDLVKNAGRLLAMRNRHGAYDIVSSVADAAYDYIAWRLAQQRNPDLTLRDHHAQRDMFAPDVPPMTQALAALLEADRFGATLDKYTDLVARQAEDAQQMLGTLVSRETPLQLLARAERAILAEGETPVTPDPSSPEAAAPVQTPPAVRAAEPAQGTTTRETTAPAQAEPAAAVAAPAKETTAQEEAPAIKAAQDILSPPVPQTFTPVPAERGTATLPGPGAVPPPRGDIALAAWNAAPQERFSIAAQEARKQYGNVEERYTNPDGTKKRGWMKAPNGQPTKLAERQWVQVRTPAFKAWFGEWEPDAELAPSDMAGAKSSFRALMSQNAEIRTADGATLRFVSQSAKAYSKEAEHESSSKTAHWAALANIEGLVARSRFMFEEKPRNGSPDIEAYVKYGTVFTFGGEKYLAKITSKRYAGRGAQNFYSVESVSVEKIDARGIHEAIAKGQPLDASDVDRISNILSAGNGEDAISSKVVDENGEPLVVWHGDMDPSFSAFDKEKIQRGTGFWFAKEQDEAAGYALDAEPRAFYLDIKNPAREADLKGRLLADYHANGGAGASWKAFISDRQAADFLRSRGYDGLEFEGKYIAFEPSQIKSATDNSGAFGENPDVRYSVAGIYTYNPRSNIPNVRGEWNEKKILRYLKANPSLHGVRTAARLISEFDTVDELKDHMFYHGTRNYVDKMQPSMTQSERWAQEHGGGGYGQRYWGISVSKSKNVASNFGNPSPGVSIYPVVLAKGAKVIDRPDLTDAADVEDHIVELWNDGVDAVRLGDWKSDYSEQELLVLNPRAICNIGTADSYRYFRLGSDENPLDIKDDAHIARMLEAAKEYAEYSPSKRFGKPLRPSLFYPRGEDGAPGEMKPREVIEAEKAQYEKDLAAWQQSEQGIAAAEYEWKMRDTIRYSVSPVYTGTAADYANRSRQGGVDDGPSLLKIGTGEGAQVYGWGLYGSTVRDVAENYASTGDPDIPNFYLDGKRLTSKQLEQLPLETQDNLYYATGFWHPTKEQLESLKPWIAAHNPDITYGPTDDGNIYEQTFFTDRAPGDESHLLKWYEPVSKETWDIIRETERANGTLYNDNGTMLGLNQGYVLERDGKPAYPKVTGQSLYETLAKELGSPKAASEFLARAGIDGVKYPVDSYGGKGVKDGDEVGWNYVSFRDDNIRVDHKWTDGQMRYSIAQTPTGEKFVLLDRPNKIDWNDRDKVREYLTTLVGSGAVSLADNQRIAIGKELPKEWTRSSYAEKVFRNKRLTKVKEKSAQHLDELIVASGSRTSEPVRDKERENGVYYRRKVKFGVAGHDTSRGYSGELVSYTENGEEMLYDLVQINDDPSLTAELNRDGHGGYEILSANHEGSEVPEGTESIVPPSAAGSQERFSVVRDPAIIARLAKEIADGDYYVTYRAMERVTLPDGTQALVPPMNGYDPETKQYIDPVQEGDWVKPDIDEAGIIEDGNSQYAHYEINYRVQNQQTGKWKTQKTKVAFNPYIHSSFNPFNDQFKAAYNRPNMVVVEMYVPYSAAQGDKAHPRAKDAPGFAQWKAGSVASQLKALGKPERQVLLSNFAKVNRVLTYSNVADLFDTMADGVKDKLTIPEEVMPPGLRDEMASRGYRIAPMRRYSVATRQFDWDALPNLNPTVVNHTSVSNLDGAKFHSERKAYYALKNAGELDKAELLARKYAAKPETQWLGKYLLAKYHADTKAAAETVKRIVKPSVIDELKAALDTSRPVVAFFPMASKESNSLNRLPLHYAKYLAKALRGRVENHFRKLPDANNTNARANERAQREFAFELRGINLSDNPQIVIVDDVWTSGQTVASAIDAILAQHPEADIRAVTTLAVSRYGKTVKPTQERLTSVLEKSTFADATALERQLGYDIRHATDSELQAYILHGKPGASGIAERFGERPAAVGHRATGGDRPGAGRVGRDLREVPGTRAVAGRETPEARASVRRGPDRSREYLAAYLAAKILAGAKPDVELADKTARAMHIPGDGAGRDALESAQRIADMRRAGTQKAVDAKDPNLMRDLMSAAVADRVQTAFQTVFTGGARGADPEAGREVERAIQRAKARDLATANGFTAAELAAELPVSLVDAIFAVDDYLRHNPDKRAPRPDEAALDAQEQADVAAVEATGELPPPRALTPDERAAVESLLNLARQSLAATRAAEADAKAARDRRAEERAAGADGEGAEDSESGAGDADLSTLPDILVERVAPVFDSPDLFAHFILEWATPKILAAHPHLPATGEMWKSPVAVRDLKRTVVSVLRQLSTDALGSPGVSRARNEVDHLINGLEEPDQYVRKSSILRRVAAIYARLHDGALALDRRRQMRDLERYLRHGAIEKGRMSAIREDLKRKVTAAMERRARNILAVINLSEDALAEEEQRLEGIIDAYNTESADGSFRADDMQAYHDAADKLAVLRVYGGMKRWMPGRIADAVADIHRQFDGEIAAQEQRRAEQEARTQAFRDALIAAMRQGAPSGIRTEGVFDRFARAQTGQLTLQLQNLLRYCTDQGLLDEALRQIDLLKTEISHADALATNLKGNASREIHEALAQIYGSAPAGIGHLLSEEIPEADDLAIFRDRTMRHTYGHLLQLYGSIIQRDYSRNFDLRLCRIHGIAPDDATPERLAPLRRAYLDRILSVLTPQDIQFHRAAVAWYQANRDTLSAAVEQVTGLAVRSPDPMYIPVRPATEPSGFSASARAWSPIPSALNRRIRHSLDFSERANILALMQEQCEVRAQTIGYSQIGLLLRDTVAHRDVQRAAAECVSRADIREIVDHARDILMQYAAAPDANRYLRGLDILRNWTARVALAGNIPSGLKQIASFSVWANATLLGEDVGVGRVLRYMLSAATAEGRQAIRELIDSDHLRARYTMGWSPETASLLQHPPRTWLGRAAAVAARLGMSVNSFVDRACILWMAQGFYRDATAKFLAMGMDEATAKQRALDLTWATAEEGQQSGRVTNLNSGQRNSPLVRLLTQFRSASILQNAYVISAWQRRHQPGGKARLIRALLTTFVAIPAVLTLVQALQRWSLGDEPPEDEDAMPQWVSDFITNCLAGAISPYFYAYAVTQILLTQLGAGGNARNSADVAANAIPAMATPIRVAWDGSRLVIDAAKLGAERFDIVDLDDALDLEQLQRDAHRLLSDLLAPYRHAARAWRNYSEAE